MRTGRPAMEAKIDELGDKIYRLSVLVPDVAPPLGARGCFQMERLLISAANVSVTSTLPMFHMAGMLASSLRKPRIRCFVAIYLPILETHRPLRRAISSDLLLRLKTQ